MSSICDDSTRFKTLHVPCDPTVCDRFHKALCSVANKYGGGIPLQRKELLQLAQACIALAEAEGGAK